MTHLEVLKSVSELAAEKKIKVTPKHLDELIFMYFGQIAEACTMQLIELRKESDTLTRSKSITNKGVGSFWVKMDKGEDGKNSLGGVEKPFYPKMKVRFSKTFQDTLLTLLK